MSTHRGPGRPVDLAKRDAILAAARAEFLDKGFERATMDAVAAGAGVSKRTVFGHFGDKVSLLEAIVEGEASRLEHAVLGTDDLPDPVAQLTRCGEALIALLVSPDILAFDRIFAFEPYRGSDLVRRFFAAGPQRGRTVVIRLVGRAAELGIIRTDDVERAADDLLALWLGGTWREEITLGLCQSPTGLTVALALEKTTESTDTQLTILDRNRGMTDYPGVEYGIQPRACHALNRSPRAIHPIRAHR